MQLEKQHVCTLPIYDPTVPESIKWWTHFKKTKQLRMLVIMWSVRDDALLS